MAKITLDFVANAQQMIADSDNIVESQVKLAETSKQAQQEQKKLGDEYSNSAKKATEGAARQTSELQKLKKEYKDLVSTAIAAGGAQTDAGRKALSEAGKLRDKIADIQAATRAYASDTQLFDTVAGGFSLISNSVQGLAGVQALLGGESENYTKILAKLNGIMALNQAATAITNNLQRESAFRTGIATAAQQIYNFVIDEGTGKVKLFNLAIAGSVVGLAAFAIFELVKHFTSFNEETNSVLDNIKKMNAVEQQRTEILQEANKEAGKEIANLRVLKQSITDQQLPREQRLLALKEYNKTADDGNKIAVTEIDNLQKVNEQIDKQTKLVIALATAKAAQNKLEKLISEQLDIEFQHRNALAALEKERVELSAEHTETLSSQEIQLREQRKKTNELFAKGITQSFEKDMKAKQEEIGVLLGLIKDLQDQFGSSFIDSDKAKEVSGKLHQSVINAFKIDTEEGLNTIIDSFTKAGISIPEQVKLLRSLGFNDKAIFAALSDAIDKIPDDSGMIKIPIEPFVPGASGDVNFLGNIISPDEKEKFMAAIQEMADNVRKILNSAFETAIKTQQNFIDSLDKRIEKQKEVVANEMKLAKEGSSNDLKLETERLDKLNQARENALEKQKKLQNAQLAVDTTVQLSSLITAAAKTYESLASIPGGVAIASALVATMFAAFAAEKVAAAVLVNQNKGFRKGGYTGDGAPDEVAGPVHGREFVFDEEKTREHRKFFEAIHTNDKAGIIYGINSLLDGTGVALPDADLPERLRNAQDEHHRIIANENNSELNALKSELVEIKEELRDWKERPKEDTTAVGNNLITRKGNRTTITKIRQ